LLQNQPKYVPLPFAMNLLRQHIEAIVFAAEQPVSFKEIHECLLTTFGWEVVEEDIKASIADLKARYDSDDFSFYLTESGGGYVFMTKRDFYPVVATLLNQKANKKLSTAALETLAIVAYKQPITKGEIEEIRGVSCDYTIQKLMEKDLVAVAGRASGPGKPLLYKTSSTFMDHFGINSTKDLPKLKEIETQQENAIGETSIETAHAAN
jgi:segregation and condensation protein B